MKFHKYMSRFSSSSSSSSPPSLPLHAASTQYLMSTYRPMCIVLSSSAIIRPWTSAELNLIRHTKCTHVCLVWNFKSCIEHISPQTPALAVWRSHWLNNRFGKVWCTSNHTHALLFSFLILTPWHNCHGWLGVKKEEKGLPFFLFNFKANHTFIHLSLLSL